MSEIRHERPGVYSAYDASAVVSAGRAPRAIGVAAKAAAGTVGQAVTLTGYAAGIAAFGEDAVPGMAAMLRLLFANGASTVAAVRVADTGETAADVLLGQLPSGVRPAELAWEALQWERETEMFLRRGRLRCRALFVAQAEEEGEVFLDFILKGVVTT